MSRFAVSRSSLVRVGFVLFLLVAFIGFTPLVERNPKLELLNPSEGSWQRQIAFLGLAVLVAIGSLNAARRWVGDRMLVVAALTLVWCLITLSWSPAPAVGFRRIVLTMVVIFTTFACVGKLGAKDAMDIFAKLVSLLVVVSVVTGLIVPAAIHQIGELDTELVGAWRGVFTHKNDAGFVAAIAAMCALYQCRERFDPKWVVLLLVSVVFLVLSRSKTSIGLLMPSLLLGRLLAWAQERGHGRVVALLLTLLVGLAFVVMMLAMDNEAGGLFDDPEAFTGRAAIWQVLLEMFVDRPITGFGYGSIYGVGSLSPLYDYAGGWISFVAHGHNGYFDLAVSIGFIGLIGATIAFVLMPFQNLLSVGGDDQLRRLLLSMLVFVALHNLMESALLDRARLEWVTLLLICAASLDLRRSKLNAMVR